MLFLPSCYGIVELPSKSDVDLKFRFEISSNTLN